MTHQGTSRNHPHSHSFRAASRRSLTIGFFVLAAFFGIELAGGLLTGSLALIADAAHVATDAGALVLALGAIWLAQRPISSNQTYGFYRTEIFAALVNGVTLCAVAAWVAFEGYQRVMTEPEVRSGPMLIVALAGFVAQAGVAFALSGATEESLNVKAAYLHVVTDAAQSLAVVAAGALMFAFGWYLADPIVSFVIAVGVAYTGGRIAWDAISVLLERSPVKVDVEALCSQLEALPEVEGVHDIHVWSITTGYEVLSAHAVVSTQDERDREILLRRMRQIASEQFGIEHVTIQIESSGARCDESHHVPHVSATGGA